MNKKIKQLKNKDFEVVYEKCIQCGVITDELISKDVNYRTNYIEGAGQLCEKCADDIHQKNK